MNEQELRELETLLMSTESLSGTDSILAILAWVWIALNIFIVVSFLLKAWGLWNINKKLGVTHPWLSWIPVVNIYMYYTAWGTSFVKYFVYPVIAYILGFILAFVTFWITAIAAVIYLIYCLIHVLHNISKATWRWAWTTVWLIFVPFIMLPIIGYKLHGWPNPDVEAIKPKAPSSVNENDEL